jgi:hypothetical protein
MDVCLGVDVGLRTTFPNYTPDEDFASNTGFVLYFGGHNELGLCKVAFS